MKKLLTVLTTAMLFVAVAGGAFAFTPADNPTETNIYQAVNFLLGTAYTTNAQLDPRQATPDNLWQDLSPTNFQGAYFGVSVAAGNQNTLWVYTVANPAVLQPTGLVNLTGQKLYVSGTPGALYFTEVGTSPFPAGTNFGWALQSTGNGTRYWNSVPGSNSDGLDHMLTYRLSELDGTTACIAKDQDGNCVQTYTFFEPYLIAWEDLPNLGDQDFNDMIYLVDRVRPIPEPMTMLLFGTGLIGMAGLRRKRS